VAFRFGVCSTCAAGFFHSHTGSKKASRSNQGCIVHGHPGWAANLTTSHHISKFAAIIFSYSVIYLSFCHHMNTNPQAARASRPAAYICSGVGGVKPFAIICRTSCFASVNKCSRLITIRSVPPRKPACFPSSALVATFANPICSKTRCRKGNASAFCVGH